MAILTKTFAQSNTIAGLAADIATAIAAGKQPYGDVFIDPKSGLLTQAMITGTVEGSIAEVAALQTSVTNLNAWATALATQLNAQFVIANAETVLPFSPALAVNYDTNPQA